MPALALENDTVALHENFAQRMSSGHARKLMVENGIKAPHIARSSEKSFPGGSRGQVRDGKSWSARTEELNGLNPPGQKIQIAASSLEYFRAESRRKNEYNGVDEDLKSAQLEESVRAVSESQTQSPKQQRAEDDAVVVGSRPAEEISVAKIEHKPQQTKQVQQKNKPAMQKPVKRPLAQSPERASTRKDSSGSPARQLKSTLRQPPEQRQSYVPRNAQSRLHSKKNADEISVNTVNQDLEERTPRRAERRSLDKPPRSSSEKLKNRSRIAYHRRSNSNDSGTIGSDRMTPIDEDVLSNPGSLDLGPLLLKLASALHLSGENPLKALECASRAAKFLERAAGGRPSLELVMSLHVLAAIYCKLGQFEEAIPVLQRAVAIPNLEEGVEHALAAFAGHMQLGDILALLGHQANALTSYHNAYDIQKTGLGEMDPKVGETCSYLAEAHVQALQFKEAEELCEHALKIHTEHSQPGSLEEAADRRLMALILTGKGEHELALEHLVLANAASMAKGKDSDVAAVDSSIGDMYVALGRYDEAVFSYQKALNFFKSANGENHTTVASVYVSLAELYIKTGKQREAKSYCENALRIYGKQNVGHSFDEIASGLAEVASVYESMNEREQALCLLQRALDILEDLPGQQSAVAGVEAQMGVLYYNLGKHEEAFMALKSAVSKLRSGSGNKSPFLGIVLNQMALACVGLNEIWHAADTFEEAKGLLEENSGPHHPDTLAVCSNLAGAYDALGRSEDAINLLEEILEVKEERLGTVHPDVEEERQRLMVLLKEAGRTRVRKTNTLEELLLLTSTEGSRYHPRGSQPH